MWSEELADCSAYNPIEELNKARGAADVVEGLVPKGGVTWMFGPSMSFKSFAAMAMAAAVSSGSNWLGRRTEESVVVYVGAEGGSALHVRRAAAELAAAAGGTPLVLAQERPMLDTAAGALHLMGLLRAVASTFWGEDPDVWCDARKAVLARDAEYATAREALDAAILWARKRASNNVSAREQADDAQARSEARRRVEAAAARITASNPGLRRHDEAYERYHRTPLGLATPKHRNILVVVDTYSQTAEDDTRSSVSTYIKNLRTIGEGSGFNVSFLVVDHVTKEGSSYLGSVAKLNDVDSQIEVARMRSSMLATLTPTKSKNSAEGEPAYLELRRFELDGYEDAYGSPLATLVVRDGSHAAVSLAANPEGNPAVLISILQGAEGVMAEVDLKKAFRDLKRAAGVKPESADKAYRRSFHSLLEGGTLRVVEGDVMLT